MKLTTIVVGLLLGVVGARGATQPPTCVSDALRGESSSGAPAPAPRVSPASGESGTRIRIEGGGFPVGADVMLVAIYGEGDCTIVGLGDQLLGATRVDPDGTYRLERPWPSTFTPLLGRGAVGTTPLPDGRYYLAAMPCAEAQACSLAGASEPGGPFVLGADRGDEPAEPDDGIPLGSVTGAGVGVMAITAGLVLLRRLTR